MIVVPESFAMSSSLSSVIKMQKGNLSFFQTIINIVNSKSIFVNFIESNYGNLVIRRLKLYTLNKNTMNFINSNHDNLKIHNFLLKYLKINFLSTYLFSKLSIFIHFFLNIEIALPQIL